MDLIDHVYEAAVLPDLWPEVLRDFACLAEGSGAVLVAINGSSFRWVASSPLIDAMSREHYNYEGGLERTSRLVALNRQGFVTESDVFTEDEVLAAPLFRDYLIPAGLGRGVATAIKAPTGDQIILHAEGPYRYGPIEPGLRDRLDALRPHLARASLMSARLFLERERTAVETLAALGLAACAVRETGQVSIANRDFEEATGYWTTRGDDRIALIDRRADQQLGEALQRIAHHDGVRSIPIVAGEGTSPAVLHVIPVRRTAHDLFTRSSAILMLTSASRSTPPDTSLLQALFDLTPAEAKVAAKIAVGEAVQDIAAIERKSVETVRNQVKTILGKTACRRQLDLVRLLAQLLPRG